MKNDMFLKKQIARLEKLERDFPSIKLEFVAWPGFSWTPEEKAEAIRRNPGQRKFWRSLTAGVELPPVETQKNAENKPGTGPGC